MKLLIFLLPLCALSTSLLLHNALAATPLYTICSTSSGNFTAHDPYDENLQKLTASLSKQVGPAGFALGSVGRDPSMASGLALCRGDVSATPCKACVADAATQIRETCPHEKEAIVWYDNCLLHYADNKFFGQIDNAHKVYMWNVQSVPNPKDFNKKVVELLNAVAAEAYHQPKLFATQEMELKDDQKLYSLAQCTRDLSAEECKVCLEGIVGEYPNCCDGKRGGRVLGGSCNFRYELYPFYGVV